MDACYVLVRVYAIRSSVGLLHNRPASLTGGPEAVAPGSAKSGDSSARWCSTGLRPSAPGVRSQSKFSINRLPHCRGKCSAKLLCRPELT